MQLAKIHKDTGKLLLQQDALKHLRGLSKGILVVALFGGARSAKSTTANMLLGKQVFGTSNATDACTLGVWISTKQSNINNNNINNENKTIIIVDSEGMGKGDTTQHPKILALVSLLASDGGAIIDNEMKDINENNLGTLAILATMQKIIRGANKYSWPALFVLLRDFTLRFTVANRPAGPTQYLNHILEDPGNNSDDTRKLIRDCFSYRVLHALPPPTEEEIMNLYNLPPGPFCDKFNSFKRELFENLSDKKIGETEIDGEQLADFLESCVDSLNNEDGGGIDVINIRETVIERFCRRQLILLEAKYVTDIPVSSLTGDDTKLQEKHKEVKEKLIANYDELTAGFDSDSVKQFRETLDTNLQTKYKNLLFDNKLISEKNKRKQDKREKKDKAEKQGFKHFISKPQTFTFAPIRADAASRINELTEQSQKLSDRLAELELRSPQTLAPPQVVVMVNSPSSSPTPLSPQNMPIHQDHHHQQQRRRSPSPSPSPSHFVQPNNGPVPGYIGHRFARPK